MTRRSGSGDDFDHEARTDVEAGGAPPPQTIASRLARTLVTPPLGLDTTLAGGGDGATRATQAQTAARVLTRAGLGPSPLAATAPYPAVARGGDGVGTVERVVQIPTLAGPGRSVTLAAGLRVKRFELIRELGSGGMGHVYLARDTKLGRLVAMKFLALTAKESVERFLVEARATARCTHENIVIIYDADEHEHAPYMALEYVEGESLADAIGGEPIAPQRAVELIVPVLRALARAHELGIVHRDLKPENIVVSRDGQVKVLDFGIAKLVAEGEVGARTSVRDLSAAMSGVTDAGTVVGTLPYMSPEQWGADEVDHRTDLWAIGIILWELVTAGHPLDPVSPERLMHAAALIEQPLPSILKVMPSCPRELAAAIDRCLSKRKAARFGSAAELLALLEPLLPGRRGRSLGADECPYPGMSAFQEDDAARFFGRTLETNALVARLREHPMVGVIGPSGVGKSSLVRAGAVPVLKTSGEAWEIKIVRPGQRPLAALAALLAEATGDGGQGAARSAGAAEELAARLREEPGYLGTVLRERARRSASQLLLFVDQFEELYTLTADASERRAFAACLVGAADDISSRVRVVVSMRSDFLDRVAEDRALLEQLTPGLLFLPPPSDAGLRDALVEPLKQAGLRFESDDIVEAMLGSLRGTSGALPLLQFTAAKLWELRDREGGCLTQQRYEEIGGVEGALATHADHVLAGLSPEQQRLMPILFRRLVTSERTRAVVEISELVGLGDAAALRQLIERLVQARLLVTQTRGDHDRNTVEIVHESLISAWPTLARWLDERADDAVFLEQLRSAAKQWEGRGRPEGLLWRGEALEDARRFVRRFEGELLPREQGYLDAVLALGARAAQRRRRLIGGAFAGVSLLAIAAITGMIWIRGAEQEAKRQKVAAQTEAARAQAAEAKVTDLLAAVAEATRRGDLAEIRAKLSIDEAPAAVAAAPPQEVAGVDPKVLEMTREQLMEALAAAEQAKARAEEQRGKAEKAQSQAETAAQQAKTANQKNELLVSQLEKLAKSETAAKEKAQRLLDKESARVKALELELRKLSTTLK